MAAADSAAPWAFEAREQLCRTYWRPVYGFVRRQGHSPEDAQDLTQEFFARFLERKQVKLADPDRGRLRSFLLSSLKNFLANERAYARAEKRGGGRSLLSLDQQSEAETPSYTVAESAGFAIAKKKLRDQLDRWMKATQDPRAASDDDPWDRDPYFGAAR